MIRSALSCKVKWLRQGSQAQGLGSCSGRGRRALVRLSCLSFTCKWHCAYSVTQVFTSKEEGAKTAIVLPLVDPVLIVMGNGHQCPTEAESERWSLAPKTLLETDCMSGRRTAVGLPGFGPVEDHDGGLSVCWARSRTGTVLILYPRSVGARSSRSSGGLKPRLVCLTTYPGNYQTCLPDLGSYL